MSDKLVALSDISAETTQQRLGAQRVTGDFIKRLTNRGTKQSFVDDGSLVRQGRMWFVRENSKIHGIALEYFSAPRFGPRSPIDNTGRLEIRQPVEQEPKVYRHGTALVIETPPLGNLETLIDDLREERIQSQLSQ